MPRYYKGKIGSNDIVFPLTLNGSVTIDELNFSTGMVPKFINRTMIVNGNIETSDCVVIKGYTIAPITATLPSPADCLGQIFIFSTNHILFNFIVVSSAGTTINSAGQTTATFNALDQVLILYAKTNTTWLILSNMGRVALS